jgi:hypothetical protein
MSIRHIAIASSLGLSLALGGACTEDPQYVQPEQALEANAPGTMDTGTVMGQVDIPLRLESDKEIADRESLAADLGLPADQIPFATIDDLSISVEWTIKNLSDTDGIARIHLNAGNQFWYYLPSNFQIVVDGEVEEEAPPPLQGDVPLMIAAGETLSGVFREDQLREMAIDLELITRAAYNPVAAALEVNEDTFGLIDQNLGLTVPDDVFAAPVRIIVELIADTHMVLEYNVRVRDHRHPGILHDDLLDAPPDELTVFNPTEFVPATVAPTAP